MSKCTNLAHSISITQTYECLDLTVGDCPYCELDRLRDENYILTVEVGQLKVGMWHRKDTRIGLLKAALEEIATFHGTKDEMWSTSMQSIARKALEI
jgi:hypothetical protein